MRQHGDQAYRKRRRAYSSTLAYFRALCDHIDATTPRFLLTNVRVPDPSSTFFFSRDGIYEAKPGQLPEKISQDVEK